MPAVSKKQYKFFQAMKNNPDQAKQKGIDEQLIKDYTEDMSKSRWKRLKERLSKDKK